MKVKILAKTSPKKIHLLAGINRPIAASHVTKLAESVKTIGIIRPMVLSDISFITGKKETYIIDGQHLHAACSRLGVDIPYIEISIKDEQELVERIALLNASSKSWVMADYVNAWGSIKKDYKTLQKLQSVYDFELQHIVRVGVNAKDGGTARKIIKNGSLAFQRSKAEMEKTLNQMTDVLKHVTRMSRYENRTLFDAYLPINANPKYNHEKFLRFLKTHKEKLMFVTQDSAGLVKFLNQGL